MLTFQSIAIFLLIINVAMVMANESVCSSFCSSLGMMRSNPGKSCKDIYQINKATRGRSDHYWINTTGVHQVFCDMELECGGHKGGWMRIANFDTSEGDACPSQWTQITTLGANPKVVCRTGLNSNCDSPTYTTYNTSFSRICGALKGYQKGNTNAFGYTNTKSFNSFYVDGVVIALDSPRRHVWTYAIGFSDDFATIDTTRAQWNCPCAAVPGTDPPAFVGDHYYCESGATGDVDSDQRTANNDYYTSDPVWDGSGCTHPNNNCCANPNAPWFMRQFPVPQTASIEVRSCVAEGIANEAILLERLELYVQ